MTAELATDRVFNFSPGPAVLPVPVLEQIRDEMVCLPGVGSSILEISHRSKEFLAILNGARTRLRQLLAIPDSHDVLFLQGGARLQFAMVPMNLQRATGGPGDYIVTGSWSKKALEEAIQLGGASRCWDGASFNFDRVPEPNELKVAPDASFLYFTSNETIQGVQFKQPPEDVGAPLVCDASSDILSRPLNVAQYGLIYACAQKNAGPAGVTIVIINRDLIERAPTDLPGYLSYRNHAQNDSLYNTAPTFGIYVVELVCRWIQEHFGDLNGLSKRNLEKATILYDTIDSHAGFYCGHAQRSDRSIMNVTFRLRNEDLDRQFLADAESEGLCGLKGHRSVGGMRASIYNAMPFEGVLALNEFMQEFARKNG